MINEIISLPLRLRTILAIAVGGMIQVAVVTTSVGNEVVTLSTLLDEMIDRDQLACFPNPPYQTLQASSYNRESVAPDKPGWFADSDGEFCIRTERINGNTEWVLMEDEGPGAITKIWAVCFYYGLNNLTGANLKVYLDGAAEPVIATNFFQLVKGEAFVKPPFADESTRAGNLYLPIPYAKSCKITMDQKAFYNIINYRRYPPGTEVRTFTMEDVEHSLTQRRSVGHTLTDTPDPAGSNTTKRKARLDAGEALALPLPKGGGSVRALRITVRSDTDPIQALRSVVLTGTFDGVETVWVPAGDFFNNVGSVRPYDMWERSVKPDGTMICRWVMPYADAGSIGLQNYGKTPADVSLEVTTGDWEWDDRSMHFYATWQLEDPTPTFPLFDWNFITAQGKGVIVGDQWTVLNPREGWWGEGDEKIYVDEDLDRNFPSHFGTGTEDYYGWAGGKVPTPADEFAKPFLGNIIVGEPRSMGYNVCTRTRVLDAIPFRERVRFDVESSCGTRQRWHYLQYAQTTYWYGRPGVIHNRPALPERAAAPLPKLSDLQARVEAAKNIQYVVDDAVEGELLQVVEKSPGVVMDHANIPVWGETSGGALKNLWFETPGDYAELRLTEQFEASELILAAAVGRHCGAFELYVNEVKRANQDLYSKHEGITAPLIQLGSNEPVRNAFTVRIVYVGAHANAQPVNGKLAFGLDYFLLKNRFMER